MRNLIDLSSLGLLAISGPDAFKFLQGQLTCNMDDVTETQFSLGAHCNPQGRIISLFQICSYNDQYLLQMPKNLLAIAANALKKYAVFFKVKLEDVSESINRTGSLENIELPSNAKILQWVDKKRFEILSSETLTPTANTWKNLDIASGIPAIYPETSEKFLPHEINLPQLGGVSFNKGCYTGQEIIARMEYRGKLKKHLYRASFTGETTLHPGDSVYLAGEPAGTIVDYCQVSYTHYELLVITTEDDIATGRLSIDKESSIILTFDR